MLSIKRKSKAQTLVVGDIQGCYDGLMRLLDKAKFNPERDRLYAVGDLVARGSNSLKTVNYLMKLGDRFSSVLGNHDLHFLAVCEGLKKAKKSDKLKKLLDSPILPEAIEWFRNFPLAQQIHPGYVMVHAGLYPHWSTKELLEHSEEVSSVLRGPDYRQLLEHMYGSDPHHWSDHSSGYSRLRFIINATTRMRFLKGDKDLEFAHKGAPESEKLLTPWFEIPNPKLQSHETILFGHWAALAGETHNSQFIGLDTGYVWGQRMSAYRIEDARVIRVKAN
ncbi:symmetrical bis(5'-nucleosyl)-tetraphosphatase [Alteromonas aestuariivivens]|uniref:bis(5'-nucleosyl)-tetraphosphatase (symmetrical) n=1 Tax=Alteromonas aestuariivivens TaxID=1938339 RepID=A0A3D8MCQ4_9ALTE|nr:symmetrical bis(5'-nucleosyl)-tetraphosphatase [Alteromonas aestuariivivens]RDV28075.1 symmetrical bis(5'-nucleosyl)-tetraphosphatase [Alteromonas aestuariivivens]